MWTVRFPDTLSLRASAVRLTRAFSSTRTPLCPRGLAGSGCSPVAVVRSRHMTQLGPDLASHALPTDHAVHVSASSQTLHTSYVAVNDQPQPGNAGADVDGWTDLGVPAHELTLDFCLPTGQSFRWQQDGPGCFTGVVGQRLVRIRQTASDCQYRVLARTQGTPACDDDEAIRDYLNLPRGSPGGDMAGVRLSELSVEWVAACKRYAHIHPYIPGARMLRQPPLECLLQFICSSNNHISRIHGMVQRLCAAYGTPLMPPPSEAPSTQQVNGDQTSSQQETKQQETANQDNKQDAQQGSTGRLQPTTPERDRLQETAAQAAASSHHLALVPAAPVNAGQKRKRRRPASSDSPSPEHMAHVTSAVSSETAASRSVKLEQQLDAEAVVHEEVEMDTKTAAPKAKGSGRAKRSSSTAAAIQASSLVPIKRAASIDEASLALAAEMDVSPLSVSTAHVSHVGHVHYAFPTLAQLSVATEEELRGAGFGYRAKFIVGTVQALSAKPGGGEAWLMGLREKTYEEAAACLEELPGVGPKVAACVCLFSLDKHDAIPVDTHVWQIATKYYGVKSKTLTKKVHADVQAAFVQRFGPYAGWAHNALFISELASHKHRIPTHCE